MSREVQPAHIVIYFILHFVYVPDVNGVEYSYYLTSPQYSNYYNPYTNYLEQFYNYNQNYDQYYNNYNQNYNSINNNYNQNYDNVNNNYNQNYNNVNNYNNHSQQFDQHVTAQPSDLNDSDQCGHRGGYYFNRIIGGTSATEGEFSWQVSVQVRSGYSLHHVCGGAILSEHWVITAGHCVSEVSVSALSVVSGDHNLYALEGTEQRRSIVNVFTTYFDLATFRNDIALLKVDSPLILKKGSRSSTICLPNKHDKFTGLATVSGWGRLTEEGGSPQSLQQVTIPLIDKYICHSRYQQVGYSQYLSECQICTGTPYGGKDSCQGDSGGPLICAKDDGKYYLCGIVSWGIGCARPEFPGVYTEVACFVDWIKNTMAQNGW